MDFLAWKRDRKDLLNGIQEIDTSLCEMGIKWKAEVRTREIEGQAHVCMCVGEMERGAWQIQRDREREIYIDWKEMAW